MIEKVDGFGHFVPIVDKSATTLAVGTTYPAARRMPALAGCRRPPPP